MLELFIKLLLAHLIGDFVLQPKKWVDSKETKKYKSKYLYAHIMVHVLFLLVLLQFEIQYIVAIGFISITHLIIDILKLYFNDIFKEYKRILFFLDQILHLLMIAVVVYYYYPNEHFLEFLLATKTLLLLSFLIIATFTSNIIMMVVLSKWNLVETDSETSLVNAGKYIGMLERLFIFFFIIMNYPLGIGFLITAKSVFRYNDLTRAKDRKLTEYVLIGSLMSFGLAILAGLGYKYIAKLL